MKISVLSSDLSGNCLSRAHLLAKVLERKHEVEMIGPDFGKGIWMPCASEFDYKIIHGGSAFSTMSLKALELIDGKVVYACKPRTSSFGIGLMKKLLSHHPVVVDVDDWESGLSLEQIRMGITRDVLGLTEALFLERFVRMADDVTVSSTFLQQKFHGTIIPHGRDTDFFNPANFDRMNIRKELGIQDERIIMFMGTPKPYKGIEGILGAMKSTSMDDLVLYVVGCEDAQYRKKLEMIGGDRIRVFPRQEFSSVPRFLTAADLIVIPQEETIATRGQVPAKIFDAMAMAKPIISTNVSDIPEILKDCGFIVSPGNISELGGAIRYVFNNYDEALKLGLKAREKCIEKYSWNSMENTLIGIFKKFEN